MDGGDLAWTLAIGVVLVVGLCGVVLPVLPGLALMWAGAVVYGFAIGWTEFGVAIVVVLTALTAAGFVAGILVPGRAAAESGASGAAQLGGLVGAVVGFFVIPVFGIIVGALAGILVVEYLRRDDWALAWAATKGTARGFGVTFLIELAIGLVMLVLWSVWALTVLF